MLIRILKIVIVLILIISPVYLFAKGPEDPGGDPGVPFDGGVPILIAAAAAYGIKKYKECKKNLEL